MAQMLPRPLVDDTEQYISGLNSIHSLENINNIKVFYHVKLDLTLYHTANCYDDALNVICLETILSDWNTETLATGFRVNLKEMFLGYTLHSDVRCSNI